MELGDKLAILAGAAKYDASCASSGSSRSAGGDGFGAATPAGVCHSWTPDGRCVSLLKVLFSNACRFDCAYCVNRRSADTPRATFTVDELVELTCAFYRRNYIEGLFLSSGVFGDVDEVMNKLIGTAKRLRKEAGYGGYIHLKIIPGAEEKHIIEAGRWADRLSANIELPTDKSLQYLAPQKSGKVIFQAMDDVHRTSAELEEDRRRLKSVPPFAPAGQSTQLIVGASDEDDRKIIALSGALYRKFSLRRVYYSAYMPVGLPGRGGIPDSRLPDFGEPFLDGRREKRSPQEEGEELPWESESFTEIAAPLRPQTSPRSLLVREHRLYQADWLLRFYHFTPEEILEDPYLDAHLDPKTSWALKHPDWFPIEVTRADYELLLRVPGIGAKSARRILETRASRTLTFDILRRLGVVLKRARYFITVAGSYLERLEDPKRIRRILADGDGAGFQLPLFDF